MVYKILSYNKGSILQIYRNQNNFYFYDSISKKHIDKNSPILKGLVSDILSVSCADICQVQTDECCDDSMLSLNQSCFYTLDRDCILTLPENCDNGVLI